VRFYRLCIDIDPFGQPLGASYEVHQDSDVSTYATVLVGPFDSRVDALQEIERCLADRFGVQLSLFS
jgi:hypothetical protein